MELSQTGKRHGIDFRVPYLGAQIRGRNRLIHAQHVRPSPHHVRGVGELMGRGIDGQVIGEGVGGRREAMLERGRCYWNLSSKGITLFFNVFKVSGVW